MYSTHGLQSAEEAAALLSCLGGLLMKPEDKIGSWKREIGRLILTKYLIVTYIFFGRDYFYRLLCSLESL